MRLLAIAMIVALAACSPPAPSGGEATTTQTEAQAAPNNCPAASQSLWSAGSATFAIEASTAGATCTEAQATIVIRDANGAVVHTATLPVSGLQPLAEAESPQDMERRLGEWITPAGASKDSTGDLAVWQAGAAEPVDAEVPFHPAEGVTREIYEALRTADAPLYCYEQSNEGGLCFAMRDGALKPLGVQTYAG